MKPIRLPRVATKMKQFVEVETASHGRAIEIAQTKAGAVVTASDGRQLCRLQAPPPAGTTPEVVDPFLVDARNFAKAAAAVGCSRTEKPASDDASQPSAADRPLVVVKVDEKTVGIAGPEGSPQTVGIAWGKMPNAAAVIDVIQAEVASGMTTAVARVNPHFLQSLADTAVAMGITSMEIAFAPRWNFMLAEGAAPDGCTIAVAIAGIGDVKLAEPSTMRAEDQAMTFTMPEAKPRSGTTRRAKPQEQELSFMDDIPF